MNKSLILVEIFVTVQATRNRRRQHARNALQLQRRRREDAATEGFQAL